MPPSVTLFYLRKQLNPTSDQSFMTIALALAQYAAELGEVPVGALIVKEQKVIATAYNLRETRQCPLGHAEILAIQKASQLLKNWRLSGCTLYVTLEPCLMCAGAIYQARLNRVVFGASDPKAGALGSLYEINKDTRLNHRFEVTPNINKDECAEILSTFFRKKRSRS